MGNAGSNGRSRSNPRTRGAARSAPGKNGGASSVMDKPLQWVIPSDFAAGREVQKAILDSVSRGGFNDHSAFAIKLALEEALINAIKHGNKHDPHKKVHIEARVGKGLAEIIIEDEGPGFDRNHVPDPTLEENLEKCSGRGILLMESYMNTVHWDRGGRRVRMTKRNEEEA